MSTVQDRLSRALADCEGVLTYLSQPKFPEGVRALVAQAERKLIDTCAALKAMRDPSFDSAVDGPALVGRIVKCSFRIGAILDVLAADIGEQQEISGLTFSVMAEVVDSAEAFEAVTKSIVEPEVTETAAAV